MVLQTKLLSAAGYTVRGEGAVPSRDGAHRPACHPRKITINGESNPGCKRGVRAWATIPRSVPPQLA